MGALKHADRALDAGVFFSINAAMLRSQKGVRLLKTLPRDRVLTETDAKTGDLEVGHDRRAGDPSKTSNGGRPVMGRKGIDKFAGFGISNEMTIDTVSG